MKSGSLYRNIALIFAALLLVFGGLCGGLELLTTKNNQQEIVQRLSRGLANHIADHWNLFDGNHLNKKAVEELFHMLMIVNPSIELYLLDPGGEILSYDAPPGRVKLQRVDMKPILAFLDGQNFPLKGDNPRNPEEREIFSVTPLHEGLQTVGYLYIVLAGDDYYRLADDVWRGHVFQSAMLAGGSVMALTLVVGLSLFYLLTRRLNTLTETIAAFDRADFSGDLQVDASIRRGDDEISRLAAAFARMAERIAAQVRHIKTQDEMRREMIANVSHDLRTPLTSMQGYLETMLRKSEQLTPAEQQKYLEVAVRQSRRVAHLAQELFELAKLELREVQPNFERFSLQELIQDVVQKFELSAQNKQVAIDVAYRDRFPLVYADIGMIERVLTNLLDNALRHTPAGGRIDLALDNDNSDSVAVSVKDSGTGIDNEYLPGLFERNSRLRAAPKKHTGGGLGLLISKRIMELHGGSIEALSTPNVGSTFFFHLPAITSS